MLFFCQAINNHESRSYLSLSGRPLELSISVLIFGGKRIPEGKPGPRRMFTGSETSTRALARPIAGTTQSPQLHCIPCHANFPILEPHELLGHVRRPDRGASSGMSGKRLGRIHVSGLVKICAQSELIAALVSLWVPCGTTNGAIASLRLAEMSMILGSFARG